MGVVHIDHKADHGVPKEEGDQHTHEQGQPDRLVGSHGRRNDGGDPQHGKGADQHAVLEEDRTARGHVGFVGEELALPPDFNHVIQAWSPAAAVGALQQALCKAQASKLFGGQGRPDKIHAFEVGVAVVHHVVARVPKAVRRERGQKRDAAQYFVQLSVGCEALVAGVVTDHEQAADDKARHRAAQQFGPDGFKHDGGRNQGKEQGVVKSQQYKRASRAALGQGHQPLAQSLAARQGLVQWDGLINVGSVYGSHDA